MVSHLQHPGSEPVIQQHIEAQDLEAGAAGGVVGETRVVVMLEDGVSGDQSLYDHVLNVVPHLLCVAADGLQELVEGGQLSRGQNT